MNHRLHCLLVLCLTAFLSGLSPVFGQGVTVDFVDATGQPVGSYLDGGVIYVEVVDPNGYGSVQVTISTTLAGDSETVTLNEKYLNSGIFTGSIGMNPGGAAQAGTVETATSVGPPASRDTLTVDYSGSQDTAALTGSHTAFIDPWGNESTNFGWNEVVDFRVVDHLANDPQQIDAFNLEVYDPVSSPGTGVTFPLFETGYDTGIFEGDGIAFFDENIEAVHMDWDGLGSSQANATYSSARVELLDGLLMSTEEVFEGDELGVRVVSSEADYSPSIDSLSVDVTASITGDSETFSLFETGDQTGVFEGTIPLSLDPASSSNGTLETGEAPGPPHAFDTLTGSYTDAYGTYQDTLSTRGSEVYFINAWGIEVGSYAIVDTVYVRVKEPARDTSTSVETTTVTLVTSSLSDTETVTLTETGASTGIFEGQINLLHDSIWTSEDGILHGYFGGQITATHNDTLGYTSSQDTVWLESILVDFIDGDGATTTEVLEGGTARLQLFDQGSNWNLLQVDTVSMEVQSVNGGDSEFVTLTETGVDTSLFEGEIPLSRNGLSGSGVLDTSSGPSPSYAPEELLALWQGRTARARTVGSEMVFIDGSGQVTQSFATGFPISVRVTAPALDDPSSLDTTSVQLVTLVSGDSESLTLTETGVSTGIFEGAIGSGSSTPGDGVLGTGYTDTVVATHVHADGANTTVTQAQVTEVTLQFIDGSGQPISVVLQGSQARVRMLNYFENWDSGTAQSVSVNISAQLTGDTEDLNLVETGPDTAIFEGSIDLSINPAQAFNGVLETTESGGQPDTLEVSHFGTVTTTATATTLGSRTWFIDDFGNLETMYASGSQVYVRVEDHNANSNPSDFDTTTAEVSSAQGDQETVYLIEVGKDSSIFEGWVSLTENSGGFPGDGQLYALAGDTLWVYHQDALGNTQSEDQAMVDPFTLRFIDADGTETTELLESDVARVQVISSGDNGDSFAVESLTVDLSALYSGDSETLTLTETGADTGIFEGSIALSLDPSSGGNGTLETGVSGPPDYNSDVVTASRNGESATAQMIGSRLSFINAYGAEVSAYPKNGAVYVRVVEPSRATDPLMIETVNVPLTAAQTGDQESLQLTETGYATGIFEGSMSLSSDPASSYDNVLQALAGDDLEVRHQNYGNGQEIVEQAQVAGSETLFIDATGQPATVFLQGSRAYLRVINSDANSNPGTVDTTSLDLTTELSGDFETPNLTETGPDTGIFEGSIALSIGPVTTSDGVLQVTEASGVVHEYDTLYATHYDAYGNSTATAATQGSRTWFIDRFGNLETMYASGSQVYVRVEDHNENSNPGDFDTTTAQVTSAQGDQETVYLIEVGKNSGLFEGWVQLTENSGGFSDDGQLYALAGDTLWASHQDALGNLQSEDQAMVDPFEIRFVDAAGTETTELLESDEARVQVVSNGDNSDPFAAESLTVDLSALYSGDSETLNLTETGADTGVFEGSIVLSLDPSSGGNGTLETGISGPPEYNSDVVTVSRNGESATAQMIGSRLFFIDAYGAEASFYPQNGTVYVRVVEPSRDTDPLMVETVSVSLTAAQTGDQESVQLTETGFAAGIFEGSIPLSSDPASSYDNVLQALAGDDLEVRHQNYGNGQEIADQAQVAGSETLFIDATGQPATVFLQGSRAYLRVINSDANSNPGSAETTSLDLTTELSGDFETPNLTETGPNTGIFEGSIALSIGPVTSSDGVLQVTEANGVVHEYDTLYATHYDAYGSSTASATTLGSRTWFIDSFGNLETMYASGSQVYVRVEDHNENSNPGDFDTTTAQVTSAQGDQETVYLIEVGKDSGLFEGWVSLTENSGGFTNDGQLYALAGDILWASHQDALGNLQSEDQAMVDPFEIRFVDEAGTETTELLESDEARVQVVSNGDNSDPFAAESLTVDLSALYSGDTEALTLTETGADTGVFEGSIALSLDPSSGGNGTLETGISGPPEYNSDVVTVSRNGESATAQMIGSRLFFIDAFGAEASFYPQNGTVYVRVIEPSRGTDPLMIETVNVPLTAAQTGDQESLQLTETGYATGVFEGSMPLSTDPVSSYDNVLQALAGDDIEVRHQNYGNGQEIADQAQIAGSETLFIDATGQPATVFLQGSRAYLRVIDSDANFNPGSVDTTSLDLTTELSGDSETPNLTETGPNTGIFEGSIGLSIGPMATQDGVLQVTEANGILHEYDTLYAIHYDAYGSSTASATTLGSRTWFIDSFGNLETMYASGSQVYVRVEDHNENNNPGDFDTTTAEVTSAQGDQETVYLIEVGKNSGLFEGWVQLTENSGGFTGDGQLYALAGDTLWVSHQDALGYMLSEDQAMVDPFEIRFVDAEGTETTELLESELARVQVVSNGDNSNPFMAESLTVDLSTLYSGDSETLTLTETSADTGVFEGSIALSLDPSSGGNGTLETGISGPPEYNSDVVTVSRNGESATAQMIGSRLFFIDAFGAETTFYPQNGTVYVRVIESSRDTDPLMIETVNVPLTAAQTGDQESLTLTETGYATGVFEGSMPLSSDPVSSYDNVLQALAGDDIEVRHQNYGNGQEIATQAQVAGSETQFIDATGQPATVFLQGSRAYLRVIDSDSNSNPSLVDTVSLDLSTELSGDFETPNLTETGADTGIFEGSIALSIGPMATQDGVLQVTEANGVVHEYDTLYATHYDAYGSSTATAATLGSRTWFIDSFGNLETMYASGSRVYVRVEDHNENSNPGDFDTTTAQVNSAQGDQETVYLIEVGKNSGLFEGWVQLTENSGGFSDDGQLYALAGDTLWASHPDALGYMLSEDQAMVDPFEIRFVDAAGTETTELLESDAARVQMVSNGENSDPFMAESLTVDLSALYSGDSEALTLTETGADTSVFEGSIALSLDPSSSGNGTLETGISGPPEYNSDVVTVSRNGESATAQMIGSRLFFIDAFGAEVSRYPQNGTVYVRVVEPSRDTDPLMIETVNVPLTVSQTGDQESLQLTETGYATGVFEGSMPLSSDSPSSSDNILQALAGDDLEVRHQNYGNGQEIAAQAQVAGSETLFIDATGQPATAFLQGSRAYLRVIDSDANSNPSTVDTVSLDLSTELSGDFETPDLTETGADTGIFEGSITLSIGPMATQDGVLQVTEANNVLHEYDTLYATYYDAFGSSTASATTLGSRTFFIDAYGGSTESFVMGDQVYVRVEDYNANSSPAVDSTQATLSSSTGDQETLTLTETSGDSGIFEGSMSLQPGSVVFDDFALQATTGDTLWVSHQDALGYMLSEDQATVEPYAVRFVELDGSPTLELLDGGIARVQLVFPDGNTDPGVVDTETVDLSSLYGGDSETLTVTETNVSTGVFQGVITLSDNPASPGNGTLETSVSGPPEYLGDRLTVTKGSMSSEAVLIGARARWLDLLGADTSSYGEGGELRLEVEQPAGNSDPGLVDYFTVQVESLVSGDSETVTLVETGVDTGLFEAYIPSTPFSSASGDGQITASGETVRANVQPSFGADIVLSATVSTDPVPLTFDDSALAVAEQVENIDVLANDSDPTFQTLTLVGVNSADNGTTSLVGDGTVDYVSDPAFLGVDTFTYVVEDTVGGQARGTVWVTINQPPVVDISSPSEGASFFEGQLVDLVATANDVEDGNLAASVTWTSDLDGALGTGGSLQVNTLSIGNHVITASVTDSNGVSGSDARNITVVVNNPPTVTVLTPSEGASFFEGDPVDLSGYADDVEDGYLTTSIEWTSDLDGVLGTAGSLQLTTLSEGTHTITAAVTDAGGLTGSDTVTITIVVNQPPVVDITAPAEGATSIETETVTFTGTSTDEELGDISADIEWSSDLDGVLGTGASLDVSTLSVGTHTVTASSTDMRGLPGTATVTVTVNANAAPVLTLTSPTEGATSIETESVTFTATATDAEDGDLAASISWDVGSRWGPGYGAAASA